MTNWADQQHRYIVAEVDDASEGKALIDMGIRYGGDDKQAALNAFLELLHEKTEADDAPFPQASVMFVEGRHPEVPDMPILTAQDHESGERFAAICGITLDEWIKLNPDGQRLS